MNKYIEIAKKIIEENYGVVGVRGTYEDEQYQVGDDCRESYEWDLENDCSTYDINGEDGWKAGGTCAIHVVETSRYNMDEAAELAEKIAEVVKQNESYGDGQQVIIAGNSGVNNDRMLDPGEVRIRNAFVIAVL